MSVGNFKLKTIAYKSHASLARMFRGHRILQAVLPCARKTCSACFSSSSVVSTNQPNAPLDLDPSLRALLKDVDMSLHHHKVLQHERAELQVIPSDLSPAGQIHTYGELPDESHSPRKSPAANFGSQRIGAVVLPFELRKAIALLISDSDKYQLRRDAQRLFRDVEQQGIDAPEWDVQYDAKYRTRRQAAYHFERDGTAFAAIALPAHYSAIYSVLHHVKTRLEPAWKIESVIDWGAGTGSGLWASLYSFQKLPERRSEIPEYEPELSRSSVVTYLGIDKRDGLVSMGKRLLQDVDLGWLSLRWQRSFQQDDRVKHADGRNMLALSAFLLSSLPTAKERKALLKDMWASGAHVMILIDHGTKAGFEAIADAREYLLDAGRKTFGNTVTDEGELRGSHVVAPCPHDGACPLHDPGHTKLVCGFSQRLQRPPFIRQTKHSGEGHEDVGYSYIAVRRGPRPNISGHIKIGRIGEVGKWEMEKEASRNGIRELSLHGEEVRPGLDIPVRQTPTQLADLSASIDGSPPSTALQEALRQEAYSWPRLIFPPLKRNGHIILDCCTAEGKIMRLTIPRSQGKQEFYDARKSTWGDIFPHEPKNAPQERYQPTRDKDKEKISKGQDIGKRRDSFKIEPRENYAVLSKELKKLRRTEKVRATKERSSSTVLS